MIKQSWKLLLSLLLIMTFQPWGHLSANESAQEATKQNYSVKQSYSVTLNVQHIDNKAAADLIVYLEPLSAALPLPANQAIVKVSQRDKAFAPYISVVQKGGQANFVNEDDITHHIYSPVSDNKFAFKIKTHEQKLLPSFEHAGEVAMGCNIHDWMSGYILVVDTPYYAKTNAQGQVEISDVIAGDYLLNIWHPQMSAAENKQVQRIEIQNNTKLSIKLKSSFNHLPEQKSEDDFDFLSDY
ncbi:hypothetical protein [Thalassotalea sp. PLHSN55]|uniref:hypothetical protein n=1 Tax=Thalassotalea sp. PLHSN55 TaxID=3435888 RepID=UPI003F861316